MHINSISFNAVLFHFKKKKFFFLKNNEIYIITNCFNKNNNNNKLEKTKLNTTISLAIAI